MLIGSDELLCLGTVIRLVWERRNVFHGNAISSISRTKIHPREKMKSPPWEQGIVFVGMAKGPTWEHQIVALGYGLRVLCFKWIDQNLEIHWKPTALSPPSPRRWQRHLRNKMCVSYVHGRPCRSIDRSFDWSFDWSILRNVVLSPVSAVSLYPYLQD